MLSPTSSSHSLTVSRLSLNVSLEHRPSEMDPPLSSSRSQHPLPRFLNTSHSSRGQVARPADVHINIAEVILVPDDVLDISLLLGISLGLDIVPVVSIVRPPVAGRLDQLHYSLKLTNTCDLGKLRSLVCSDLLEGSLLLADLLDGHDGDEDDGGEGDHPARDIGPGGVRVVRVRVAVIVKSRKQQDTLRIEYLT